MSTTEPEHLADRLGVDREPFDELVDHLVEWYGDYDRELVAKSLSWAIDDHLSDLFGDPSRHVTGDRPTLDMERWLRYFDRARKDEEDRLACLVKRKAGATAILAQIDTDDRS